MSFLGILLSGVLSIALWFEVSNPDVASEDRAPFIIAGLLQTFLFVASILGFVGTVVRKQSFVQAYAYFLYGHLLFNIAVAAYFLWVVTHFSQTAAYRGCVDSIRSSESEDQCVDLLKVVKGLYIAASTIVILIEGYGAIIVARYVNQIKGEKRVTRNLRTLAEENELGLRVRSKHSAAALDGADRGLLHPAGRKFDPYADAPRGAHSTESADTSDIGPPAEVGYGGGSWTMQEISSDEKAKLGRDQRESSIEGVSPAGDERTRK